jgi:hypothetical protein
MKATEPGRVIGVALESLSDADFENCGIENCELKIGKILVFVNPHWALGSLADNGNLMTNDLTTNDLTTGNQKLTILDQFTLAIKKALEKLGLFLTNGIAKIKEVITEKITTKEITTQKICVEGEDGETICLTKDQVKELMNQKQIISGSGQTINNSQQTINSSQETSTSTTETTTTETTGAIETSTTTTKNGEPAGTTTETTEMTTE